jgi:hypothetical protein
LRVEWIFAVSKNKESTFYDKKIGFKLSKVSMKNIEFSFLPNSEDGNRLAEFFYKKVNTYGFHEIYKATKKIGKGSFACVQKINLF